MQAKVEGVVSQSQILVAGLYACARTGDEYVH
jgi:hypothetical protein